MAQDITILKTELFATAIQKLTGERPAVNYFPNYSEIYFSKNQAKKIQEMIEKEKESDIRIKFMPVIIPIAIKKLLPYGIGLFIAGLLTSKLLK